MSVGPDGKGELTQDPTVCSDQKKRTAFVEKELKKTANRLERDQVASVFHLQVYAFNCTNKEKHGNNPAPLHVYYVAGGGRFDVPGALQSSIKALEHALAELKSRVK